MNMASHPSSPIPFTNIIILFLLFKDISFKLFKYFIFSFIAFADSEVILQSMIISYM